VAHPVPAIETTRLILPGGIPLHFCRIPAGTFWMGSRERVPAPWDIPAPPHQVRIEDDFWLGQTPVTLAQFRVFVQATGTNWKATSVTADDQPVVDVSWDEALAFCDWLNSCRSSTMETAPVRWPAELADCVATLPTEAEWERACRGAAGDSCVEQEFGCGDGAEALAAVAWFGLDWNVEIPRVQQKHPTDWGLYDLHGLVWEWCHDEYSATAYAERAMLTVEPGAAPRLDPEQRLNNVLRVVRGGAWFDWARDCRAAVRVTIWPESRFGYLGFRVCLFPGPCRAKVSADQAQAEPGLGHAARRPADAEWERQGGAGSAAGPPTSGP
jgi:formylglycine-generating enzyme required for sulfatase activity